MRLEVTGNKQNRVVEEGREPLEMRRGARPERTYGTFQCATALAATAAYAG